MSDLFRAAVQVPARGAVFLQEVGRGNAAVPTAVLPDIS